ncbi:MAG: diguanylate cyclase [Cellvibrionaceae bacterium]|nr:diguanylate cyclase [Cellvibrionaceae bacterium]
MKILLVEDSATLRHAMCGYIRADNHEPIVAKSGEEALQIIDNIQVDMVIMDVEMPGLDGFETTRLIREWLDERWIPIIFVTGRSEDNSLQEGIEAGGDDYLIKPISRVILRAKIRAMERITTMRDQLNELNRDLVNISQRDGLTNLYNRRTFDEKAVAQWRLTTRTQQPLSVLLIDIDHFKQYNDFYGHQAGDVCIKAVAQSLTDSLNRPTDLLARYGGEEFIILLPDTPASGAVHVGEHLRKSVEALRIHHKKSPNNKWVTVSVGISVSNRFSGNSLSNLISLADQALYQSKGHGRNRVSTKVHLPEKAVLVVDTDQQALETISQCLRGNCSVVTTDNTEECLQLAEKISPDLVMMDTFLPGLDSYTICQGLRSKENTLNIPLVLMSDCTEAQLKKISREMNADAYLQKPIDDTQFNCKVSRFMH